MFSMPSGMELILIVVLILLLFGGKKIPELAKGIGSGIKNFKNALKEEDEDQIEKFLKEFNDFELQKVELKNYSGDFLRLTPFRNDTDGFFAAVMTKQNVIH